MTDTHTTGDKWHRIFDATDRYFVEHGRFPTQVRLGAAVARKFFEPGQAEAMAMLNPSDPESWARILPDKTLDANEIVAEEIDG